MNVTCHIDGCDMAHTVCCSMLQCVAASCSELQGVAVRCSHTSLQHIVTYCNTLTNGTCCTDEHTGECDMWRFIEMNTVCHASRIDGCDMADDIDEWDILHRWTQVHATCDVDISYRDTRAQCSVLQCVAVCCSVLQCVAVCCSACDMWRRHII